MHFTIPLTATKLEGRLWYVEKEFTYYIGEDEIESVTVPEGFVSDLASVPRGLWNICPPDGSYTQASVLHDFCCLYATWPISKTDYIFYESMKVLGVPQWNRWMMWTAVRIFHFFHK
jgi:hypothetical protein